MSVLICGSIAFDRIMVFQDRFKEHILPDQLHILNVSFLVPEMRFGFGGCAGNIAYGLKQLEVDVYPMGTVGQDFDSYEQWLGRHRISQDYIKRIDDQHTASAFIVTDLDNNQITAFHPGAMNYCHEVAVPTDAGVEFALISPEGRDGMLLHARQCIEAGIPYMFDPGQGISMFSADELEFFIQGANWIACNDYESQVIVKTTGFSLAELASRVEAMFVTCGGEGSVIYNGTEKITVPAVVPDQIVDPTGCGDAYRAGIISALCSGKTLEAAGRIASLMGTYQVECSGTQQYTFGMDDFAERFEQTFGDSFQ